MGFKHLELSHRFRGSGGIEYIVYRISDKVIYKENVNSLGEEMREADEEANQDSEGNTKVIYDFSEAESVARENIYNIMMIEEENEKRHWPSCSYIGFNRETMGSFFMMGIDSLYEVSAKGFSEYKKNDIS